jgi:FAD-dependent halogenase
MPDAGAGRRARVFPRAGDRAGFSPHDPVKTERTDLVVIGAGPAGTTLAGLVKKYSPERRVILLEKAAGPRHHIGESLLPGLVPVLKELGVYEKIDAAGFPRKIGANYQWGLNGDVWENDFNDVNVSEMMARGGIPEKIEYSWQVRRSRYDEILLEHARGLGVEIVRGAIAEAPLEGAEGRIEGVRARIGAETVEFRADFTADCSGQSGFLSRFRRVRDYNAGLKNVAGYSYWRGAEWKYKYSGHPDKTKIFVCSVPEGWFWYIPIDDGVVSIGLVTGVDRLKAEGGDLRALYDRALASCPEIQPLLARAERLTGFDGTAEEFFTHSDWSYLNVAASGPGWLAAGDAAVFVDPILSSGVTLAHLSSHRAAYALLAHWGEPSEDYRRLVWEDYGRSCRESAAQFLALAMFWYGRDRHAASWWLKAKDVQRAWLPAEMGDHTAFITVSAGLTRYYERALSASRLLEESAPRPEDYPFYVSVLGRDPALEARAGGSPEAADRPRLPFERLVETVFLPKPGEGKLQPVQRVRFLKFDPADAVADAGNPRLVATRWHLALLDGLEAGPDFASALDAAARAGAPEWWRRGPATVFVRELVVHGVLSFESGRPAAARP